MAQAVTIARPYAEAAFSVAKTEKSDPKAMASWSDSLAGLAEIAQAPAVQSLFGNPAVGPDKLATLFIESAGNLSPSVANFVRLLAQNDRLFALPEVAHLFEALRNADNDTLAARVETAFPLSAAEQAEVVALLKKNTVSRS